MKVKLHREREIEKKRGGDREGDREETQSSPICWFFLQIVEMTRTGPGLNQELGAPSKYPTW